MLSLRLTRATESADLDRDRIAATPCIEIDCDPGLLTRAAQVLLAVAPVAADRCRVRIVARGAYRPGQFVVLCETLEGVGLLTEDVTYGADRSEVRLRKADELGLVETEAQFDHAGRRFRLASPSARDALRRFPVHLKTFYEEPLLRAMAAIDRPGLYVDGGAHVGNHGLYMARLAGRAVVAFEPHPANRACLQHNLALNGVADRVAVRPVALGAAPGRLRCAEYRDANPGAARFTEAADGAGEAEVVRLDDVAELRDRPVAILKLDVEGMEAAALSGATGLLARWRPAVFCEVLDATAGNAVAAVLARAGYRPHRRHHEALVQEFRSAGA